MTTTGMSHELGYLIKEVQQAIRKKMDKDLADLGLTTPQYSVLSELEEFPGLSSADLARKSFVTPQTMNLIVQKLEERHLVRRYESQTHGKIINTEITAEGVALLARAHELVKEVQAQIFGSLSAGEAAALASTLKKLRGHG